MAFVRALAAGLDLAGQRASRIAGAIALAGLLLALTGVGEPAEAMGVREQAPASSSASRAGGDAGSTPAQSLSDVVESGRVPVWEKGMSVDVMVLGAGARPGSQRETWTSLGDVDPAKGTVLLENADGVRQEFPWSRVRTKWSRTAARAAATKGAGYCPPSDSTCATDSSSSSSSGTSESHDAESKASGAEYMLDTYQSMFGQCWMCTFVATFVISGDQFAREAYLDFAGEVSVFLYFFFGLWIIIQATKLIFPSMNDEPGKVLIGIALKGLALTLIAFMLSPPQHVLDDTREGGEATFFDYGPELVVASGASLAMGIVDSTRQATGMELIQMAEAATGDEPGAMEKGAFSCGAWDSKRVDRAIGKDAGSAAGAGTSLGNNIASMDDGVLQDLTCMVHQMQIVAGLGLAVAGRMFDFGDFSPLDIFQGAGVLQIIPAGVLALTFAVALIAFVFYLLDALVRVIVMSALAPILMGLFLFKPTRDMAVTGFKVMISGGLSMIGLAVVFGLGGIMMMQVPAMVDIYPVDDGASRPAASFGELLWAIHWERIDNDTLTSEFDLTHGGFWYILLAGLLINKLMRKVGEMIKAILDTAGADRDSMGAASQALVGGAGKMALTGTVFGGFMLGSKTFGAEAAAGGGAAAGSGATRGLMGQFGKARFFTNQASQAARNLDQDVDR